MKVFTYSSCSTCRRAIKWLESNEIEIELNDILDNPPSKEMLISASEIYGDRKYILNTSGLIYRSIGAKVIKGMTNNEFFDTLYNQPKLIKRPFLYENKDLILVGFKEEKWTEILL